LNRDHFLDSRKSTHPHVLTWVDREKDKEGEIQKEREREGETGDLWVSPTTN
jgi:hypothetical protein